MTEDDPCTPPEDDPPTSSADAPPFREDAQQVLDRVTDAFVALNEALEVTHVNARAETLLHRSADDLVGATLREAFPGAADTTFESKLRTAAETRTPVHFEERYPPLDAWFSVRAYPTDAGLSVYFRDTTVGKTYRERLATIHETTRQMMRAETPADVASVAVEGVRTVLGFPAVAVYLWDDDRGVLRPAAATDAVADRFEDGLPTLTGSESLLWDVFVDGELRVYTGSQPPREEMLDPDPDVERRVVVPLDNHGVFAAGTPSTGETSDVRVDLLEILAENATAAVERAKREQSIAERDERLERTNERLSNLENVTQLLWEVDRALIRSTQRSEIEYAVCEKLTDIDGYRFAWFGERDPATGRLTVRASSGADSTYLDQLLASDGDDGARSPARRAVRSGDTVFAEDILAEPSDAAWRQAALNAGHRAVASIPVQFRGVAYGLLEIYTDHPRAFSEEERSVLRELGEVIGNAFNAIERKEALLADTAAELTFRTTTADALAARVADELDTRLTVESLLPRADDTWLVYVTIHDADPERVAAAVSQRQTVERVEHVDSPADGHAFELVLSSLQSLDFVAENGGSVVSIEATPDATELTVEVPESVDVRAFVEAYQRRYREVELVSRRPVADAADRPSTADLASELTDRQRDALAAAVEAGYFEWPRDRTAEEIAESLGVTPPTFHRHLRVALRKVVSGLFE